ncbi:transcriptional adapter 2-alpha isoform X2 [Panulirus ornatus]|uniref:transcriptional adapter 2-alpha isoform X2 n=1 Tax=Panulirus ornatus TaxID=150431 RepID=UPI003A871B45
MIHSAKGLDSLWEASMEKCGLLDALDPPVVCKHCKEATKEPYIQCVQCEKLGNFGNVIICVPCFTKGVEFDKHRNDHSYIVIRTDFCLFEPKWQAKDELRLINAINDCGVGNWQDVSYRMQGKSAEECKAHYMKYYIDSDHPELSKILRRDLGHTVHPQPVSYVGGTDDPPRPLPGTSSYRDMAGYNAARGDFDVEHDNTAEVDIQDLDLKLFEEDEKPSLGFELQVALLDIYRRRLGERHRRKKLIKNHGLIAMSKSIMMLNRYRSCLPQPFADALPRFFSIFDSVEFDLLLEGLKCETELKRQVFDLMEYRSIGITKQVSIMTYETLKKRRDLNFRERRNLVCMQNYGVDMKWNILKKVAKLETTIPGSSRRVSIPLNIVGMPGYESLNYTEKQIASELRLVPEDFLRFKSAFINECRKLNGLKLGQARTLIRIDVNKIRKIYDYLLSAGLIHTPSK